jgi:C4-dicarboxylate-specific signal transduction histidine kinase
MTNQSARKHLLIVDDEPVILQILKAVFDDEPVRLTCVGTGGDAVRVLEEQGCDLLITDKNLPDINGLELLQRAKAINPYTEVIIITGYASLETALTAMEHDAFDYVVKPLNNVFDIRKKVRRALEKQGLALENARLVGDLQVRNQELEAALSETRSLQAELIQSEKLAGIGTLAAGVAHEVSSPLFGILGLAEAIPDEDDRQQVDGFAEEIVGYCHSIREIVVDLSSYSRTSQRDERESTDLSGCVRDAHRLVARAVQVEGVTIDLVLEDGTSLNVKPTELTQIFVNLLKNAVEAVVDEHPDGGGTITITSGRAIDHVWISVVDNGVGIAEDTMGQVFDPFYTTKPPGKGTGLGLNVVYRIVTKYRGTIAVEPVSEGGTQFRIRFPVEA